jgi:hypothetical protein
MCSFSPPPSYGKRCEHQKEKKKENEREIRERIKRKKE